MMSAIEKTLLAVLFACADPISAERIAAAEEMEADDVRHLLHHLADTLDEEDFPLQILDLDGSFQLTTRERDTESIRRILNERRNVPLSQAALEVLAAVAYNQPVTRAYIEQVRGVDSSGTVASLVEKGLLEEAGRLDLPGRPIAYKTTPVFLRTFGLSSLSDLPAAAITDVELPDFTDDTVLEGQTSLVL